MQSTWYQLHALVLARLKALADARSVKWADNPPLPLAMDSTNGTECLFVLNRGDRLVSSAGLREQRQLRFVIGATSLRTQGALAVADELHFAARSLLRGAAFQAAFQSAGAMNLNEVEVEPDLQSVMAPGNVLLSAFEGQYHQIYPNAAR